MVGQLAQRGAPHVIVDRTRRPTSSWPTMRVQTEVFNAQPEAIGYGETPDVVGLFAWLI